jgi:hypothetical protein
MPQHTILPINVSSRVLRHISRGIYRTPAGALKELVSNAYDAGASDVTINTGFPAFNEIVVTDNGQGISADNFKNLIQHIGLSEKTIGSNFKIPSLGVIRATIGHYGIGLLAVGQLGSTMTIRSKEKGTREGFRAELDFEQFEVSTEDGIPRSHIKDEAKIEKDEESQRWDSQKGIAIGKCKFWKENYPNTAKNESFTKIVLTNLRIQAVEKLRGTLRDKQNPQAMLWQEYSATFSDLLRLLREKEGLAKQGIYPYEQLVWELGVYCPVAYPNVGEFVKKRKLATIAEIAKSTNFTVKMDGMEVLKPFEEEFFQDDDYRDYAHVFKWINETYTDDKTSPTVSGYLIFKPQIRPKAIQGILVRESGVAVGLYDTTYLQYPFYEGYKFNQLTGELYASGLSGALNIDRNSFNETDDRYVQLSVWLHAKLQKEVFPKIKQIQKAPAAKRRQENQAFLKRILSEIAKSFSKKKSIHLRALGADDPLITLDRNELIINTEHPDGKGSGVKREKVLLAAAFVLAGYVKPEQLAEIEKLIEDAKREGKES